MKSPYTSAVQYMPLIAVILAALWHPDVASAADDPQGAPPLRGPISQAHRNAHEEITFKLKKAMKAGELWSGFWWGGPRECHAGFSGQNSPGLVTKTFNLAPGQIEPASVGTWQYDQHGNTLVREWVYSDQYTGPQWDRTECEYADGGDLQQGKLVRMTQTSSNFPPWPVYRATYNAIGRHDVETEEYDFDQDGTIDAFGYTRYIYNDLGLLIEQVFENDDDANGTIDFRYAAKATYDSQLRIQRIVKGYYDYPGGPFAPYETFWIEFNDTARSSVAIEETDYDLDGVADDIIRSTTYYDEAGRFDHQVYEHDSEGRADGGADGIADYTMNTRQEYDAAGNITHTVYEISGSQTLSFMDDFRMTYDERGRLIQMVYYTETYWNDEVFTDGDTTTYTRNQHGKVVEQVNFRETSWFSQTSRIQYRYDGIGNLIEMIDSFWWDDDPEAVRYRAIYEYAAGRSGQTESGNN
jgi:hypothetical protein